ncbi:MAG: deacylase [Elusimicrobia bacterium]|nr:deacylase [Elusimicrobiota bacterium]
MNAQAWVAETLSRTGAPFEKLRHPVAYTAQQLAEKEHVSGKHVCKVVVVQVDGKPKMLVLPACRSVDLLLLRAALGARSVELAAESEVAALFPDCEIGAEPPLRAGIEVLMDRSMQVDGDVVFPAGSHEEAIRMPFRDWFRLVDPRVESFTAKP